jgi:hypothetical protein
MLSHDRTRGLPSIRETSFVLLWRTARRQVFQGDLSGFKGRLADVRQNMRWSMSGQPHTFGALSSAVQKGWEAP